jgi:hypothetical protein
MKYQIINNFGRIGLHDSHFSNITFDKNCIAIKVDWGFLENFEEENILEPIVFDRAELFFNDVQSQTFKKFTNDNLAHIDFPESLFKNTWLIMTNELVNHANVFSMVITMTNDQEYLEWTIEFKSSMLTWGKYILHKNWLNGTEKLD